MRAGGEAVEEQVEDAQQARFGRGIGRDLVQAGIGLEHVQVGVHGFGRVDVLVGQALVTTYRLDIAAVLIIPEMALDIGL